MYGILMDHKTLTLGKTKIYGYRIFDVGDEIDVSHAAAILDKTQEVSRYQLRKTRRSLIISHRPVVATLASTSFTKDGRHYPVTILAKIWAFGAVSLQLSFELNSPHGFAELAEMGHFVENDPGFHGLAQDSMKELVDLLRPAIDGPRLWDDYEDYIIYAIEQAEGLGPVDPKRFIDDQVTAMIFGERPMAFAPQVNESLEKHILQYGCDDLVMIHWNGALIYDLQDGGDIADIIEFALCQLLELRYYDQILDDQLNQLYQNIESTRKTVWRNPYAHLSKRSALQYIELSDIIDKVSNAFKTTGDFYYATIFRAATQKFYIPDWRNSVSAKLNNLAEVSKLFQGEVNERRNQIMEATIVVLIAVEVLPALYDVALGLLSW